MLGESTLRGVMKRIEISKKMYHLSIIAILKPFADSSNVISFKNKLDMDNAIGKFNGKIWLFWNGDVDFSVKDQDEQQITCDFTHNELQKQFTETFLYAKCKEYLRRTLWDKILQKAQIEDKPWCSVGDYNVIA